MSSAAASLTDNGWARVNSSKLCRIRPSRPSAGVRWGFLKGAVGGSIQSRSVGGQHVSPRVLGGSLRLRLHVSLGGHLALVLLRGAGGGASVRVHLGSGGWLEVIGVLTGRKWVFR